MTDTGRVKKERTFWYTVARIVSFITTRVIAPVRYHHIERIRAMSAPAIIISNHQSALDPLVLGWVCPYEIRFLGKRELEGNPVTRYLMNQLHMIPVNRKETDIAAMRACVRALKEGAVLGIFPEGTRHLSSLMETVESGVSLLALRSGVPLLPVYIDGKLKPFRRNLAVIGESLPYEDLVRQGAGADTAEQLSQRIRETFFALRDEASRLKSAGK